MSEAALRLRIRKIRNQAKMRGFVQELETAGLQDLADEARQALKVLQGA